MLKKDNIMISLEPKKTDPVPLKEDITPIKTTISISMTKFSELSSEECPSITKEEEATSARKKSKYFRFHYTFGGPNQGQGQQQQGGFNIFNMIIVIGIMYMIFGSMFKSGPSYSLLPTSEHKYKQKTSILGNDFYVSPQFF